MCGIAGFNWSDGKLIKDMMEKMAHRGPDDSGNYITDSITLGHKRLSILDVSSAGHQPMFSDDEDLVIVYNGEIYNSPQLRLILEREGFHFKSSTDTEVILNSYKFWGSSCLHKFKGMFAFAIYVSSERKIFLARDHAGIKPLYYHQSNSDFIFSSTIEPLFSHNIDKKVNEKVIRDFLLYNITDHLDETFFEGIKKFPKAHYATFDLDNARLDFFKWWDNDFSGGYGGSYKDAINELRKLMSKSVERHLLSDVPVGTSLSGGMDSSAIACLIDKSKKSEIETFSAVFPGFIKDESRYIEILSSEKGIRNHRISLGSSDLAKDIFDFVRYNEEPLPHPSPYAQYKVFQLAKKNKVTVILDGQGADELFAGYHYFFGFYFKGLVKKGEYFRLLREVLQLIRGGEYKLGLSSFVFLLLPLTFRRTYFEKRTLASDSLIGRSNIQSDFFYKYYSCSSLHEALKFHLDHKLEHLLKWGDRNSMSHSREGRVPFLDVDIIKFVFSLPEKFLISNGRTKSILRNAMKIILPKQISNRRDKIGFDTPENEWLRDPSISQILDKFLKSRPLCHEYVDIKKVRRLIRRQRGGNITNTRGIWQVIFLECWMMLNEIKA